MFGNYTDAFLQCNLCPFDGNLLLDLKLRKQYRSNYPGYCSLNYQSAMQIVLHCLFGWDPKKKRGSKAIVETLEAFCRADEE